MVSGRGSSGTEREAKTADFGLAAKNYAPLICRVVRAVRVLGAGLGFPLGGTFGFTPQTSDPTVLLSSPVLCVLTVLA